MASVRVGEIEDKSKVYKVSGARRTEIAAAERRVEKARIRIKGREDRATVDHVLDKRTLLLLSKLLKSGSVTEIYGTISTGKEANVYHAVNTVENSQFAVKVFKTSVLDFRDRERYITGEFRFRQGYSKNTHKMVKLWAEKEFRNLKRIYAEDIPSPEPIALKSHVILMGFIGNDEGEAAPRLKDADLTDDQAHDAFIQVIGYMRTLYQKCELVHGDLSEYNLLWYEDVVYVIDVGQSVQPEHPMSHQFLLMDCRNILDFFRRQGVSTMTIKELFHFIIDANIDEDQRIEELLALVHMRLDDGTYKQTNKEDETEMSTQAYAPRSLFEIDDIDEIPRNSVWDAALKRLTGSSARPLPPLAKAKEKELLAQGKATSQAPDDEELYSGSDVDSDADFGDPDELFVDADGNVLDFGGLDPDELEKMLTAPGGLNEDELIKMLSGAAPKKAHKSFLASSDSELEEDIPEEPSSSNDELENDEAEQAHESKLADESSSAMGHGISIEGDAPQSSSSPATVGRRVHFADVESDGEDLQGSDGSGEESSDDEESGDEDDKEEEGWEERPKMTIEERRALRKQNKKETKLKQREKRATKTPKHVKKRKEKLSKMRRRPGK